MNPTFNAFLQSWPYDPWLVASLIAAAGVYLRGWLKLRRHNSSRWHGGQLAAFGAGLLAIFAALASPIESFASLLLQVHMLQHMLLLVVAPPLIWVAQPLLPMLRGLPRAVRTELVVPILQATLVRDLFTVLVHPFVAWPLMVAVVWLWHSPRGYELALADPAWHVAEHLSFTISALLFWFPIVIPYPSRPRWSRWIMVPYLILADVQNTLLAAWLTFASEPIYPHYTQVPQVGGWTPLADQQAAGVLMWVPGSVAFLVPVFVIGLRMLNGSAQRRPVRRRPLASEVVLTVIAPPHATVRTNLLRHPVTDLLQLPLVGELIRSRWFRPVLQSVMLGLATLVILDGLFGPNLGPANVAGVAPWIHWRGLIMFGLLLGGNFFCMACPFTLPRSLAVRWLPANRKWPRALQSKWLAIALVALFLWSYEAFSLWDSPWLTAWITLAYFATAFIVDGLFRGASFCKYVCPIGQFNFVQSLISPLEVAVRDPAICSNCRTKECIRGSAEVSGCGTDLFQQRKVGNLDCTFCLDCIHACPHDNVGLLAISPARQIADTTTFRSGIGSLAVRPDFAVLVLLLAFGSLVNAGGMVAPVVAWQDELRTWLGRPPLIVVVTLYYVIALVLVPTLFVGGAATLTRWWISGDASIIRTATCFSYALVPMGFSIWLAHYGFHFFTSYGTIVPVAQRMAIDFGLSNLSQPEWRHACCLGVPDWIIKFELLTLDIGLLSSVVVAYRIASNYTRPGRPALVAAAPWIVLLIVLFLVGVWIVLEPMQMRGTLSLDGS